jgi:hypothetical protein
MAPDRWFAMESDTVTVLPDAAIRAFELALIHGNWLSQTGSRKGPFIASVVTKERLTFIWSLLQNADPRQHWRRCVAMCRKLGLVHECSKYEITFCRRPMTTCPRCGGDMTAFIQ